MTESSANNSPKSGRPAAAAAEREARRAEQLRENLRKRKDQARARTDSPDTPPSPPSEDES